MSPEYINNIVAEELMNIMNSIEVTLSYTATNSKLTVICHRGRGATGSRGSVDPHFFRCGVHIWMWTPHFL